MSFLEDVRLGAEAIINLKEQKNIALEQAFRAQFPETTELLRGREMNARLAEGWLELRSYLVPRASVKYALFIYSDDNTAWTLQIFDARVSAPIITPIASDQDVVAALSTFMASLQMSIPTMEVLTKSDGDL